MVAPHDDRAPLVRRTRRSPDGEAIRAPPSGVVAVAPLLSATSAKRSAWQPRSPPISAKALSGSASPARSGPVEFAGFAASNTWRRSARPPPAWHPCRAPPAGWAGRPSPLRLRPRETRRSRLDRIGPITPPLFPLRHGRAPITHSPSPTKNIPRA
jgi:hypothetical protein